MSSEPFTGNPFAGAENDPNVRAWATLAGSTSLVLGTAAIAYNGTATVASIFVFGWTLILAGAIQMVHAYQARDWEGFFPYLLIGIIRTTVGWLLVLYPTSGTEALTMVLSFYFVLGGLFTTFTALALQFPSWRWSVASGLTSTALAFMLAIQWPASGQWFIGLAIGIDLIAYGCAILMFAAAGKTPAASHA